MRVMCVIECVYVHIFVSVCVCVCTHTHTLHRERERERERDCAFLNARLAYSQNAHAFQSPQDIKRERDAATLRTSGSRVRKLFLKRTQSDVAHSDSEEEYTTNKKKMNQI